MNRLPTLLILSALLTGCRTAPVLIPPSAQTPLDPHIVTIPPGFQLVPYIRNLTAPTAIAFDSVNQTTLVAAGGIGGDDVHLYAYKPDGHRIDLYPFGTRIPLINSRDFKIRGPIGGIVVDQGRILISHRDQHDRGVISSLGYDGSHKTIVANLPAQGEYSVTDLAINPANGRLYFGVGSATNSGVVGIDDWDIGWVSSHKDFCDQSAVDLKLLGYRFDTHNPPSGIFGGADIAVTAPFQPFANSKKLRIPHTPTGKPTAAVYSVNLNGTDLRVEAHGIRNPVGLQFNEFGRLYLTNQGMQLRGTRPVKNDPDSLLWLVPGVWYGWPDFSADLYPIADPQFQPPTEMIVRTGYPELSPLIDHETSNLVPPDRNALLRATFPSMSGASKFDFAPATGPLSSFHGQALIPLAGDLAPFANAGDPLPHPVGYKIVRVDVETQQVHDFIFNTQHLPASQLKNHPTALERPIDLKFAPDGSLYIVDEGELTDHHGQLHPTIGSGKILHLIPLK
ncbi:MAG TPA: hypothetical protein VFE58_05435 [Tepidisphaeraceae bacterium]|nr:hypothetical protein [Tepidisphaeraceae bacterium]